MKEKQAYVQLYTPEGEAWMEEKASSIPWNIYPRPHLRRRSFLCLNGEWEFAVSETGEEPTEYGETICVPFVPQSVLSGIGRTVSEKATLCYRRRFPRPESAEDGRVLLHLGGVDQIARVWLNGHALGEHRGGYAAFSYDITDYLEEDNLLTVLVTDELEDHVLPYGKQKTKRGGMWYTPISGIWQTVWLECVPGRYVRELTVVSFADHALLRLDMSDGSEADGQVTVMLPEGERVYALQGRETEIFVDDPILWSPERPHLYRIRVEVGADTVESYFALRSLEIREVGGIPRLCLNGAPYFFHGLLDQGYFSDGIFLPAKPEGYERDILAAKGLGFNMLRKHIKVEPEQFYYDCDRLGMVVFQDMVNNGDYSFLRDTALPTVGIKRMNDRRLHRDRATREAFLAGMTETVKRLSFHPSVCYWTIFNEGWGQFDHAAAYDALKALDSTRFVDSVSGWFRASTGETKSDVDSHHVYFKPYAFRPSKRPVVLSEFGGYAYRLDDHAFNLGKPYGYRFFKERAAYEQAVEALYRREIIPAAEQGLCADVYTQLTDVEDETNGLLTYDRRVEKVDRTRMCAIGRALQAAVEGNE